jgi:hypothetical protein
LDKRRGMTELRSGRDVKAIWEKGINKWKMGLREMLYHEGEEKERMMIQQIEERKSNMEKGKDINVVK